MTNYNDGKWHGWNGGECPVHPETVVHACFEDGLDTTEDIGMPASLYDWKCDDDCAIIAFRVVKEQCPPPPREMWVCIYDGTAWDDKEQAERFNRERGPILHMQEVQQ